MVEICDSHTGKMEGIQSISTSVLLNPNCQERQKIKGTICSKCYAENMAQMYSGLSARLARNTKTLTTKILSDEELPDVSDQKIFRLESFGDINNKIQLQNYINLAKKNSGTRFTLWTKMYKLAYEFFSEHEVPENFTLIISSLMINKKTDISRFKELGKFRKGQLKVFTVYDLGYVKEHWEEMDLNCGSRFCFGCRLCYDLNEVEEINEILKSDQPAVDRFIKSKDPKFLEELGEEIDDLWTL